MDLMTQIVATVIVSLVLSLISYKLKLLTKDGTIATFAVGSTVGIFSSPAWFILLIIFTTSGLVATKVNFKMKMKDGLQEGKHGERTYRNVLGVGIPPCTIAVLAWLLNGQYDFEMGIAFISTMTVAAADTISSEIGVKDKRVWLITTFKRVEAGVNGGISVLGTVSSFAVSIIVGIIGWLLIFQTIDVYVIIPIIAGMVGNFMDSIFGATLEDSGYISKYTNNCSTALIGAAFSILIICLL